MSKKSFVKRRFALQIDEIVTDNNPPISFLINHAGVWNTFVYYITLSKFRVTSDELLFFFFLAVLKYIVLHITQLAIRNNDERI